MARVILDASRPRATIVPGQVARVDDRVAKICVLATLVGGASLRTTAWESLHLYHHQSSRISMACEYAIELYGPDAARLPQIAEQALDEVDRIDRLMSHYKADSPLSQINREASRRPVRVDPELFSFIADAMR